MYMTLKNVYVSFGSAEVLPHNEKWRYMYHYNYIAMLRCLTFWGEGQRGHFALLKMGLPPELCLNNKIDFNMIIDCIGSVMESIQSMI